jgi:hypothetical protein
MADFSALIRLFKSLRKDNQNQTSLPVSDRRRAHVISTNAEGTIISPYLIKFRAETDKSQGLT